MKYLLKTLIFSTAALSLTLQSTPVQAIPVGTTPDTRPAAPQQRKQWETQGVNLQVSGSMLQGNVNLLNAFSSLSYNLNFWEKNQLFLDVGNLFTQAGDNVVANRINGSLLYAYNMTKNLNLYAYNTNSFDQSIKLDYRLTNGAGVCFHSFAPQFSLLLFSFGLAGEHEWFQQNIQQNALRGVARMNGAIPVTDFAEVGLDAIFSPVMYNFADYRVYGEAYIKFKLTENISLKLSAADEFDSVPQSDVKNNDFGVFATMGIDLGN